MCFHEIAHNLLNSVFWCYSHQPCASALVEGFLDNAKGQWKRTGQPPLPKKNDHLGEGGTACGTSPQGKHTRDGAQTNRRIPRVGLNPAVICGDLSRSTIVERRSEKEWVSVAAGVGGELGGCGPELQMPPLPTQSPGNMGGMFARRAPGARPARARRATFVLTIPTSAPDLPSHGEAPQVDHVALHTFPTKHVAK